jgi:hypothetical protein
VKTSVLLWRSNRPRTEINSAAPALLRQLAVIPTRQTADTLVLNLTCVAISRSAAGCTSTQANKGPRAHECDALEIPGVNGLQQFRICFDSLIDLGRRCCLLIRLPKSNRVGSLPNRAWGDMNCAAATRLTPVDNAAIQTGFFYVLSPILTAKLKGFQTFG